jgi:hypothetical protein
MPCSLLVDADISEECAAYIFTFEVGRFRNVLGCVGTLHGGGNETQEKEIKIGTCF